jgi:hypothetical protein
MSWSFWAARTKLLRSSVPPAMATRLPASSWMMACSTTPAFERQRIASAVSRKVTVEDLASLPMTRTSASR